MLQRSKLRLLIQDLDNARSTIAELEAALSTERAQLRSLSVEQNKVSLERENVLAQLKRTENVCDIFISQCAFAEDIIGHGRCQATTAAYQEG